MADFTGMPDHPLTPENSRPRVVPPFRTVHGFRGRAMRSSARVRRCLLAALATVSLGGCAAGLGGSREAEGAANAPAAVERFLRLAGSGDYAGMGRLFGTTDGAILSRESRGEVERRMYALATLLKHDEVEIGDGAPVPARSDEALWFEVTIRVGPTSRVVPFVAVRGPRDRWYIEQLDVVALTGGG